MRERDRRDPISRFTARAMLVRSKEVELRVGEKSGGKRRESLRRGVEQVVCAAGTAR